MQTIQQERSSVTLSNTIKPTPFFGHQAIQRKLSIGASNDVYEVEADAMADKIVNMSSVPLAISSQSGALVQRKCAACEEEMVQKKSLASQVTPVVQRKSLTDTSGIVSSTLSQQINTSRGGGDTMDKGTQQYMESRFGADFSQVHIHTGTQAIQMSRELNAQAFTVGNDIYFNEGKYNPSSNQGKHLLAHELTHTLQQFQKNQPKIQRMLACPSHLSSDEETPDGWKSYFGNSCTFHCCFRGILENKTASPSDPQNECFYDDSGRLVDENHEYAGCAGTPNDYDSSSSTIDHIFRDRGGIWEAGRSAYNEARRFQNDRELIMSIGTTSRTQAEPHLGRSSRVTKTGAVWVVIGEQKILIVATEVAGSRSLQFNGWVNSYFTDLAIERATNIQGSIPEVDSSVVSGIPSSIPDSVVSR